MSSYHGVTNLIPPQRRDLWRVNRYLWLCLAFAAAWMAVKGIALGPGQRAELIVIYVIAVANVGTRSLVALRSPRGTSGELGWAFTIVDIALIACAVHITGRLASDLWLIYFFLVVTETLSVSVKAEITLDIIVAVGYTAAVWPITSRTTFITRLFFLFITGAIARRLHANAELRNAQVSQLREELKVEQEKSRLAREIHDGVGREIVNAILGLEIAARTVLRPDGRDAHATIGPDGRDAHATIGPDGRDAHATIGPDGQGRPSHDRIGEEAANLIRENIAVLRAAMDSTRQLIFETRPWTLDETTGTLSERIVEYARRFADRTGVVVDVDAAPSLDAVPQSTAFAILRVMQESLNNAAKHANAGAISIRAACVDNEVRLTVSDDGVGFDPAQSSGDGIGLKSMRERAEAMRGDLQIDSAPGQGTTVNLTVPLR